LRTLIIVADKPVFIVRIALVVLILLFASSAKGQQDPLYTQYMESLLTLNPAYAGSKECLNVMAVSRNQWVAMPDAPVTRSIAAHSPVADNMGLGLSLISDQIGPVSQTGMYIDYSYTLKFRNHNKLAFGLKGGVNFYEAGLSDLTTIDADDPVYANDVSRSFLPNVGVGAFFHAERYYFGLSIPKLIENEITENGNSVQNISREKIHLFFMAGYVFDLTRMVKFKPSILTNYIMSAPISLTINTNFLFYDKFWLGAMYRIGDSFGGLFQLQVNDQLKVGYSYDLSINQLGAYNSGTHEIMLSYDFDFGKRKRSHRSFF